MRHFLSAPATLIALLCLSCSSSDRATSPPITTSADADLPDGDAMAPTDDGADGPPFAASPATVYVPKIKNVLVGLPAIEAEIDDVQSDPAKLKGLIATWMQLPQYATKMQRFFELAFQQTQVSAVDFSDQAYPKQIGINTTTIPQLVQNAQESFARTMLALNAAGKPMTQATTTSQLMMTTALKELYAFLDVWEVDNAGKVTDGFRQSNPGVSIVIEASGGPIPIAQTLDPASANYMHWYDPDAPTASPAVAGCGEDPIVLPASGISLHYLLYGSIDGHKSSTKVQCPPFGGSAVAPQLTAADFSDWTMVAIRPLNAGEKRTAFYDLSTLRHTAELVLSTPRIGFFSTPAFFANWQTNTSNQMRVTMNQSLIVALGSSVDGTDETVTPGDPPPGFDAAHAAAADCAYCHKTLDPLRSIFSSNYSWNYHQQLDTTLAAQHGMFSFRGVVSPVSSMSDFGAVLARHPLFPTGWAQKLCYYVNSAPCAGDDPEFLRVVKAFEDANYSWNTLVTELLASPLTTNATETTTAARQGEVVAVARRDHFCAALNARLGFADVCGLDVTTKKQSTITSIVSGLPSDGYGRGSTIPVLPNAPTLFYRGGIENICAGVATYVIDTPQAKQLPNVKQWSSTAPDAAIADFVSTLMALVASDPRSAEAAKLLKDHYTSAVAQGAKATDALKSTFVVACLAPSSISIGL